MQGSWMTAVCLKIFVIEAQCQDGMPLFEWLLEQAQKIGVSGGTTFRSNTSYGRHFKLHEEHSGEPPGEMVEVEFLLNEDQETRLLDLLRKNKLSLFYVRSPAECGVTT